MEALSIGIPCIAADCPGSGVRALMAGGARGLLVPVGDEAALAEAMQTYVDNPDLAARYGQAGLEIAAEYAPEPIGRQWLDLMHGLASSRPRPP